MPKHGGLHPPRPPTRNSPPRPPPQHAAAGPQPSSPPSQPAERPPRDRHASPFGTRFLLHARHVALKGQFCSVQTLDGKLLDERSLVPHLEELLWSVHQENHSLACQSLFDVIRLLV